MSSENGTTDNTKQAIEKHSRAYKKKIWALNWDKKIAQQSMSTNWHKNGYENYSSLQQSGAKHQKTSQWCVQRQ